MGRPRGTVPCGETVGRAVTRRGECSACDQRVALHRQAVDRRQHAAAYARAEGGPRGAVPRRQAVGRSTACRGELSARDQPAAVHRQRVHVAVYAGTDGRPAFAVPLGQRPYQRSARLDHEKAAGRENPSVVRGHGANLEVCGEPGAQGRPGRTVPAADTVQCHAAGPAEAAPGVHLAVLHENRVHRPVEPVAQRPPARSVPARDPARRLAARRGERPAHIHILSIRHDGVYRTVQDRVYESAQPVAHGQPSLPVPACDSVGGEASRARRDRADAGEISAHVRLVAGERHGRGGRVEGVIAEQRIEKPVGPGSRYRFRRVCGLQTRSGKKNQNGKTPGMFIHVHKPDPYQVMHLTVKGLDQILPHRPTPGTASVRSRWIIAEERLVLIPRGSPSAGSARLGPACSGAMNRCGCARRLFSQYDPSKTVRRLFANLPFVGIRSPRSDAGVFGPGSIYP